MGARVSWVRENYIDMLRHPQSERQGLERAVPYVLTHIQEPGLVQLHMQMIEDFARREQLAKGEHPAVTSRKLLDIFFRHPAFCANCQQEGYATVFAAWKKTVQDEPASGLCALFDKCAKHTTQPLRDQLEEALNEETQKASRTDFRTLVRHIDAKMTRMDFLESADKKSGIKDRLSALMQRCESLKRTAVVQQVKGIKLGL